MEKELSTRFYGSSTPLPMTYKLKAGPLSMLYEKGALRYIAAGGKEIVRMIHPAVRDRNWGTAIPQILQENLLIREDHFEIFLDCRYHHHEIDFSAHYNIFGTSEGRVVFTMKGMAIGSFLKNRIGLCVLHPLRECTGQECLVTNDRGEKIRNLFPWYISPHQPMKNIASLEWQICETCRAELTFRGDVFEMEDHRNWVDASFKIYSTPLELPFPVRVNKGETIEQQIELQVDVGTELYLPATSPKIASIDFDHPGLPFPSIGTALTSGADLTGEQKSFIRKLRLDFCRIDVHLHKTHWEKEFTMSVKEAQELDLSIELVAHVSQDYKRELHELILIIEESGPRISHVILFHHEYRTTPDDVSLFARKAFYTLFHDLKTGGGTNAYYAELNRERPDPSLLGFVCFSLNPQVHASDNRSITETPEAIGWAIQSAKSTFNGIPVVVSPVTLKPRFNPNATSVGPASNHGQLPETYDTRQMSLFGAAWTVGCLKALAEKGVSSVTLYEPTGLGGLMDSSGVDPYRHVFPVEKNSLYPVYHILKKILEWKDGRVLPASSPEPHIWDLLVFKINNWWRIICVNYTMDHLNVDIPAIQGNYYLQQIDVESCSKAIHNPDYFSETLSQYSEICQVLPAKNQSIRLALQPLSLVIINGMPTQIKHRHDPRDCRM